MRSDRDPDPSSSAAGLRLAVVVSRYHRAVTDALLEGAIEAFRSAGGRPDDLHVVDAPGAFELPVVAAAAAGRADIDGVVALGCIVRGETEHDRHIAGAVANGITYASIRSACPIGFGVLTCNDDAQARARAGGEKGNKGHEAMAATIAAIRAMRAVQSEYVR